MSIVKFFRSVPTLGINVTIFTARKRSLRQGNVFTRDAVNEQAVRILLERILVFCSHSLSFSVTRLLVSCDSDKVNRLQKV